MRIRWGLEQRKVKVFPKWRTASHEQKLLPDPVYGGLDGGVRREGGLSQSSGSPLEGVEVSQIIEAESMGPQGSMLMVIVL